MAAIIRKWRRIVALGCTHGNLLDPQLASQVLKFIRHYAPDIKIHLGDVMDTAAFRGGAAGTPDEQTEIEPDFQAACGFLEKYQPTHITWGNHDHRLWIHADNPKAVFRDVAKRLKKGLLAKAREIGAKTYEYHYRKNVVQIGGVHYLHGISFAENAIRLHAEYVKGRVVFAHTHRNGIHASNSLVDSTSINVGTLAAIDKMGYAHQRMATGSWAPGIVIGEYTQNESRLWLIPGKQGGPLIFPPGVF